MRAAVLKRPRTLALEDVLEPVLNADEVLVSVRACGICGSDVRYYEGENPWALHTLGREKENPPNIILGHEFAGDVVDVGDDSLAELKGKRVVVSPYRPCGRCRLCRMGSYHMCSSTTHLGHGAGWGERDYYPGGMAEFCQVWADKAYPLPENVSYEEACLLDIVGIAIHGANVSGMRPGCDVAILGAGPLGLSFVQIARIWGAKTVFCTDLYPKALEIAGETGADEAIDVNREDVVDCILAKTGGFGVEAVFDTVGTAETNRQGLRLLAPGGTLVNMATNVNEVSFKLVDLGSERAMRSSSNYFFHEFQTALELAASGKLKLATLITHRFPLDQVQQAFDTMIRKQKCQAIKVIVQPNGGRRDVP